MAKRWLPVEEVLMEIGDHFPEHLAEEIASIVSYVFSEKYLVFGNMRTSPRSKRSVPTEWDSTVYAFNLVVDKSGPIMATKGLLFDMRREAGAIALGISEEKRDRINQLLKELAVAAELLGEADDKEFHFQGGVGAGTTYGVTKKP